MGSYGIHNIWVYNIFDVLFYPGIILLYSDVFGKSGLRWLITTLTFGVLIWEILQLFLSDISIFNTYFITIISTIIIFLALSYLVKLFLDTSITSPLKNDFYYWFSVGFVIYFVFNAVMLGMYTQIIESKVIWYLKII